MSITKKTLLIIFTGLAIASPCNGMLRHFTKAAAMGARHYTPLAAPVTVAPTTKYYPTTLMPTASYTTLTPATPQKRDFSFLPDPSCVNVLHAAISYIILPGGLYARHLYEKRPTKDVKETCTVPSEEQKDTNKKQSFFKMIKSLGQKYTKSFLILKATSWAYFYLFGLKKKQKEKIKSILFKKKPMELLEEKITQKTIFQWLITILGIEFLAKILNLSMKLA